MIKGIPPGFESLDEALLRAAQRWGHRDGIGRLKGLLVSGGLTGWYRYLEGDALSKLAPDFWLSSKCRGVLEGNAQYYRTSLKGTFLFESNELDRVFPTPVETDPRQFSTQIPTQGREPQSTATKKNFGGSPGKYNWDAMWVEIASRLFEDGISGPLDRKAEIAFRKGIQQWFSDQIGDAPDDKLIRPKIQLLFERLRSPPTEE